MIADGSRDVHRAAARANIICARDPRRRSSSLLWIERKKGAWPYNSEFLMHLKELLQKALQFEPEPGRRARGAPLTT